MDNMEKKQGDQINRVENKGWTECDFENNSIFKGNVKHEMMKRKRKNQCWKVGY